jgi:outer membrane lipopolysaccharide assembly protein LptE/RlpB
VVSVLGESQSKEVSTINSGGKVNEYLLSYNATVRTVIGWRADGTGHGSDRASLHELFR